VARGISQPFSTEYLFPLAIRQKSVSATRARRYIELIRKTVTSRFRSNPFWANFACSSCAPRDFSTIFRTTPICLGNPTEEGPSYASAKTYSIMAKPNDTPSSQMSIFGRVSRVFVRAAGFLRHLCHNTHFPWQSDREGSQLSEREELFNYVEALWHAVVSKNPSFVDCVVLSCAPQNLSAIFGTKPISLGTPTEERLSCASAEKNSIISKHYGTPSSQISIFCRFGRVFVRAAGFLRHFLHKAHFPWQSDREGSQLCEREEIFNNV